MSEQERTLQNLKAENEKLHELQQMAAAKDKYRAAVEKLLPVEDFDYDVSELEDLLANPDKYQTLDEFLRALQASDHGG